MCIVLILTAGCGWSKGEHTAAQVLAPENSAGAESSAASLASQEASDDYPYDIAADRKNFDSGKIDITVGDKFYMTQINDWYANFSDYDGKSVVIDGYYMIFDDKYTLVGRKGPTCPYCTGGYVKFEFKSDQDLSGLVSESSWIRVTGILRKGTSHQGSGQPDLPFYYIEAMCVEKLPEVGLDTIAN